MTKSKLVAWKSRYENLFYIEFPWVSSTLSGEPPFQGPPIKITTDMVTTDPLEMKEGKVTNPCGLNVEMILAGAKNKIMTKTHLVNCVATKVKCNMIGVCRTPSATI